MSQRIPSFFMLVPGPWHDAGQVVRLLQEQGIEARVRSDVPIEVDEIVLEIVEDLELAEGFARGRYGPSPFDLVQRVAACTHAVLLEFGFRLDSQPQRVARLGRVLRDAGGAGVRIEASGSPWAWEPWLERLDRKQPAAIYETAVILVQWDDGVLFTCGMHAFDLPDAEIAMDDASEAVAWLDTFNIWQLAEWPTLGSGHTFRPDETSPRRTLERWPDHRHHPADGRHNPYGLWRFLIPGAERVPPGSMVSVTLPPLVTLLTATEETRGRALSRHEVEELAETAPAIAMELEDAVTLERSRGFADIERELAWEQWRIVRSNP